MKKLFFSAALFASLVAANAQQFGVKGGLTLSGMDGADKPKENKATVLYEAGVVYKIDLGAGFALQPALAYQVKGAKLKQNNDVASKTGFAEFSVGAQWGPDLLIARPFVFAGPYVGLKVSNQFRGSGWEDTDMDAIRDGLKKAEWGLGIGLGIQVFRFQITGKYNWNFGAIADTKQLPTLDAAPRTFEICLGLKF